jgi:hypothetical protein
MYYRPLIALCLGLVSIQVSSTSAMAEVRDDLSMTLYRASKYDLASQAIALKMASMLIEEVYGADELKAQSPLEITDSGEVWVIKGSTSPDDNRVEGDLVRGPMEIQIVKANCRVVKFIRSSSFK